MSPARTGQTSWADAQAKCTAAGDKGLATIDNAEENAAVLSVLAGTDAYIGLSDTATEVRLGARELGTGLPHGAKIR